MKTFWKVSLKYLFFIAAIKRNILFFLHAELLSCDIRCLIKLEEEHSQLNTFRRIFPGKNTSKYFQYMEVSADASVDYDYLVIGTVMIFFSLFCRA